MRRGWRPFIQPDNAIRKPERVITEVTLSLSQKCTYLDLPLVSVGSKCSEKCDERVSLFDRETPPKLMTLNCSRHHAVPSEACGHVVVAQASRIESILKRSDGAVML